MNLQVNKVVNIPRIPSATAPDAVARIGNLSLNHLTNELTYAMHFYQNVADADNDVNLITTRTYVMTIVNLQNQILTNAKTKQDLNLATNII